MNYIFFELNYGYHLLIFYEENANYYSQVQSVDRLVTGFKKLMTICQQKL